MLDSESNPISLGSYYAFHRASAVLSQDRGREIGKVFAEHKDKLFTVDGEIRKEHVYSIPETEVDLYGDKKVYLNISENSLREFEIMT